MRNMTDENLILKHLFKSKILSIHELILLTGKSRKKIQSDISNLKSRKGRAYRIVSNYKNRGGVEYEYVHYDKERENKIVTLLNLVFR